MCVFVVLGIYYVDQKCLYNIICALAVLEAGIVFGGI